MPIGVKGQYYLELGTPKEGGGGSTPWDDLTEDKLHALEITEKVGNVLPLARLHFSTQDDTIALRINELKPIRITAGIAAQSNTNEVKSGESASADWIPVNPTIKRSAANEWMISTNLVLYVPSYANTAKVKIFGLADAIKVARSVLGNHFVIHDDSVKNSEDQMNYIQPAITDMEFVRHLTRHAWIRQGDSWNAVALTTESRGLPVARVFDMADQIMKARGKAGDNRYLWHFSNSEESSSTKKASSSKESSLSKGLFVIAYGEFMFVSPTGLLNALAGYDRTNLDYDMESPGIFTQRPILSKIRLTNNSDFVRVKNNEGGVGGEIYGKDILAPPNFGTVGHNVHPQYYLAAHSNLANRALFSSFQCMLSYDNLFIPHFPLDIAQLSVTSAKDPRELNESLSGMYIVSAVTRSYAGKRLKTSVTLCREAPEGLGGGPGLPGPSVMA